MNNRSFKLASEDALNRWTCARFGKRAIKVGKKDMRRYRRTLEKRALRKEDAN